ncbi:hypothetical protein T11_6606 [Trichinella zimbabwensis]|uniref:Uncharacterized protein n=1 Tax=Trichinella zimbabwensis TaxID=268475 RepID=A0A0V1GH32_9BILA|nr:hypothetical protein T11_6606 [Trichinella zimbabwensis]
MDCPKQRNIAQDCAATSNTSIGIVRTSVAIYYTRTE